MALGKSTILFDGGKRIKLSTDTNAGNEGMRLTKNADGSWDVVIKTRISKDEAKNIIFKYSELDPTGNSPSFETDFPNMIYFTAMDTSEKPIDVPFDSDSELLPSYDRDLGGSIILKLNIGDSGKTQNVKTQNVHV